MKRYVQTLLLALTWGVAGQVVAMPMIEFTSLTARFENAVAPPAANVIYNPDTPNFADPATATWGAGGNRSGYEFEAAMPLPDFGPNVLVDLGDFTHMNMPINSGSSITSIDLVMNANITVTNSIGGMESFFDQMFTFSLTHFETPNDPGGMNRCANGELNNVGINENGCADIVTLSGLPADLHFLVGGEAFTLEFLGFDLNGNPVDTFETKEQDSTTASLLASFHVSSVPEPGTLALLGLGLIGLGFRQKRR